MEKDLLIALLILLVSLTISFIVVIADYGAFKKRIERILDLNTEIINNTKETIDTSREINNSIKNVCELNNRIIAHLNTIFEENNSLRIRLNKKEETNEE